MNAGIVPIVLRSSNRWERKKLRPSALGVEVRGPSDSSLPFPVGWQNKGDPMGVPDAGPDPGDSAESKNGLAGSKP